MKKRSITAALLLILSLSLAVHFPVTAADPFDQPALVYVILPSPEAQARFACTHLPVYARLEDGVLSGAGSLGQQSLREAGLSYIVLDPQLGSGSYYLVSTPPGQVVNHLEKYGQILLDEGRDKIMRIDPSQISYLSLAGAEIEQITLTAKPLSRTSNVNLLPEIPEPDILVKGMIDQVSETQVSTYDRQLAGVIPVDVDGEAYTITTRYTYSGTPIEKTTRFIGQHLQALGLDVEYHQWGGEAYPNVIGEIHGSIDPADIFIIGAHLDDVPGSPGADDNASGSVATLMAADILSQYRWGCTLRFAFWTGEEEGLLGSAAYARRAYQLGEDIQAYLNLDMIAWNSAGSQTDMDLIYNPTMTSTLAMANLFSEVVSTYNINLIPEIGTSLGGGSDHSSFWRFGFPSILSIEDQGDFNPYYHKANDTPANTDLSYFTDFVKAALASFAHMTNCLLPSGHLEGHITSVGDDLPVEGAAITAKNRQEERFQGFSNSSGHYSLPLPAGVYTVTVSADGFIPAEMSNMSVFIGSTTSLDFALDPICNPITGLDFTWQPAYPFASREVSFTAAAQAVHPIHFAWDFGDAAGASGITATHSYTEPGIYTITLTASNICDAQSVSKDLTIFNTFWAFLPFLVNGSSSP